MFFITLPKKSHLAGHVPSKRVWGVGVKKLETPASQYLLQQ